MEKISKFNMFCNSLTQLGFPLSCPICCSPLHLDIKSKSLVCKNKHTFDISKQGFCTLIKNKNLPVDKHYTGELFCARRQVILNGFFNPVIDSIAEIINASTESNTICDLGSGEGSISNILSNKTNRNFIAIDLSKPAVKMSSDYVHNDVISLVADLNFLPIPDKSIDIIINFLSPINPTEANRILKDTGYIIKIIPSKQYLHEIRQAYNIHDYKEEVLDNLKKTYNVAYEKLLHYVINPDEEYLSNILSMTPLTAEQNIISPESGIKQVTISLKLLILTKI